MTPVRCVTDTNVLVTANGGNESASAECAAAGAKALQGVQEGGHVFLDATGSIVGESQQPFPLWPAASGQRLPEVAHDQPVQPGEGDPRVADATGRRFK